MTERFTGSFTQQEPIPEAGIEAAIAVLRHGRLHRYNTAPNEIAETALLEQEFADLMGAKYCLAVASGGYALGCALRSVGMAQGEAVLTNAFTLAPVPGAIAAAGGRPIFVEVTADLTLDFHDLAAKALEHIEEVERLGGMAKAIEQGVPKLRIEEAAAKTQARIDAGRQSVVGVNRYKPEVADDIPVLKVDNSAVREQQLEKLARLKAERDPAEVEAALT